MGGWYIPLLVFQELIIEVGKIISRRVKYFSLTSSTGLILVWTHNFKGGLTLLTFFERRESVLCSANLVEVFTAVTAGGGVSQPFDTGHPSLQVYLTSSLSCDMKGEVDFGE